MHILLARPTFHGISGTKDILPTDANGLGSDYYLSIIARKTDD